MSKGHLRLGRLMVLFVCVGCSTGDSRSQPARTNSVDSLPAATAGPLDPAPPTRGSAEDTVRSPAISIPAGLPPRPSEARCLVPETLGGQDEAKAFYSRRMVERGDGCVGFEMADPDSLPEWLRLVNQCWAERYERNCANSLAAMVDTLERTVADPDSLSWIKFVEGTLLHDYGRFASAGEAFLAAAHLTGDAHFRFAAEHRALFAYLRGTAVDTALILFDTLWTDRNAVERWGFHHTTYPKAFCEVAEEYCVYPPSLEHLSRMRGLLLRQRDLQRRLDSLSATADSTRWIATSNALAEAYEEWCLSASMFAVICPQALTLYSAVVDRYPHGPGADRAALRVSESRFAYEYEGERLWWAGDALTIYGDYLREYPNASQVAEVCDLFMKAVDLLAESGDTVSAATAADLVDRCR